jgi:hypothetical protein
MAKARRLLSTHCNIQLSPANGQKNINPDKQLAIAFSSPPTIGSNGTIRVYDAENKKLIDMLDLSIPSSPSPFGNGSTKANYSDTTTYQTNIIGGMDFYLYPIIVRGNTATIYLHNNQLDYGRKYIDEVDPEVLSRPKVLLTALHRVTPGLSLPRLKVRVRAQRMWW